MDWDNIKYIVNNYNEINLDYSDLDSIDINVKLNNISLFDNVGQKLIFVELRGDTLGKIVDANTGKLIKRFGRMGRGPGEFVGHYSITADENGFFIHDIILQRGIKFSLSELLKNKDYFGDKPVFFKSENGSIISMVPHLNSKFVGSGLFKEGRISFYNENGEVIGLTGNVPISNIKAPPAIISQAFIGQVAVNPSTHEIALATRYSDRIEIYKKTGKKKYILRGPKNFDPVFEVAQRDGYPALSSNHQMRIGYVDISVTDKYIYALYNGRTRGESDDSYSGSEIFKFNWEGEVLKLYHLPFYAGFISVDRNNDNIYLINSSDHNKVYKIND
ncbi:MAG: BF3164 family lipoprotein [Balneolaceae bacterium]